MNAKQRDALLATLQARFKQHPEEVATQEGAAPDAGRNTDG